MHPIFGSLRSVGWYVLAWAPVTQLIAYLVHLSGGLTWPETLMVSGPLCAIYAVICLSPWYSARFLPLRTPGMAKALFNHIAAAVIASGLWLAMAHVLTAALGHVYPGIAARARPHFPLLFAVGVLLYLLAAAMHYVYIAVESSRDALRREHEARVLAREAELKALKAQINPHFLFNCLHSISALTAFDPAQARDMCIRLSDFLRNTLRLGERESIPFADEMNLIDTYLAVEQVRFGSRLRVERKIESACDVCTIPPLLLQPLVENAVKHGIAGLVDGGIIRLEASCDGGLLHVVVENDFDPEHAAPRRTGLGLANVRSRIAARHGDGARVEVEVRGATHRVEVVMPCEAQLADAASR
jgi:two-component system sensor histidine kinase AlgZ